MPLRTQKRNQIKMYVCQRDFSETQYRKFIEPVEVDINFMPANSRLDIEAFGENYVNYYRGNTSREVGELFHRTDRIYIGTAPSVTPFDTLCNDAPFEVESAPPGLNGKIVLFKKRSDVDGSNY